MARRLSVIFSPCLYDDRSGEKRQVLVFLSGAKIKCYFLTCIYTDWSGEKCYSSLIGAKIKCYFLTSIFGDCSGEKSIFSPLLLAKKHSTIFTPLSDIPWLVSLLKSARFLQYSKKIIGWIKPRCPRNRFWPSTLESNQSVTTCRVLCKKKNSCRDFSFIS